IAAQFHQLPRSRSQAWTYGIVFVVLLHAGLIYALVTGLAANFSKYVPPVLEAHILEQPQQPPPKQPPPPEVKLAQPPQVATVPPPDINIQAPPAPSITAVTAPPAPPAPIAATPVQGIASTHSIPPYPPVARRLNHQGTVVLNIAISDKGAITDVQVAQSSGFSELDDTAVGWVKAHWRYRAATEAGRPVASTVQARVRFNLQEARS
ncbi:MAG TPA: energy transducer TonB, partial [Rhizomicrobium sp.]|nr:energy transducer TonB [Rhizomicrobium sp.]